MPSTNSDSKTTTTPWKGYQPYLVGEGPIPSWITQGAPTGMPQNMMADMAARAAGSEGSWLQPPPLSPFEYSPQPQGLLTPPGIGGNGGGPLSEEERMQGLFDAMNDPWS